MSDWLTAFSRREALPSEFGRLVEQLHRPLAMRIVKAHGVAARTIRVGVCGSQGSGKSTLVEVVSRLLAEQGLTSAILSLDDLYLTRAEREILSEEIHPLLRTRGVPGTHDVALGISTLAALERPGRVALPRFDKAADDRRPIDRWPQVNAPVDVILFEGWCVGSRPQDEATLASPVNALEREEDAESIWRLYSHATLAGPYRRLFDPLDLLVLLAAPGFEAVGDWRLEQETKLGDRLREAGEDIGSLMDARAILRFIAHYERLTRWILEEMPPRADVLVRLDRMRQPIAIRGL